MEANTAQEKWSLKKCFWQNGVCKIQKTSKKTIFWPREMTKFAKTIGEQQNSSVFLLRNSDLVQI